MEDTIHSWIYSVLMSGCICSILLFFNAESKMRPLLETGCACAMILIFISPMNEITFSMDINTDYKNNLFSENYDYNEIHKAYIEDEYASYILNVAEQYGVSLSEVKVTVVQDNHENWIPYEVEYTTHHLISAEFMKHIHNELGVAEERQYINDANDFQ